MPRRGAKVTVKFVTQNLRGLKTETRLEELFAYVQRSDVFAACVQETWRPDSEQLQNGPCLLLCTGLKSEQLRGKRGSQGVGIVLSSAAVDCWKLGGCELHEDLGARVIAARLVAKDKDNKDVGIFLVSAYAPVSTASDEEWQDYYERLQECIDRRRPQDILLIGSDCNSSIGTSLSKESTVVGSFGLQHMNQSGRRLINFLAVNNMSAVSTYFPKRNYGTWRHPRSKCLHQLDHFLINLGSRKSVMDAGITSQMLYSDHLPIRCKIRLQLKLKKRSSVQTKFRQLDFSHLKDSSVATNFCNSVEEAITTSQNVPLSTAIKNTAEKVLPKKPKVQPGWFQMHSDTLTPLIQARNNAMSAAFSSSKRLRSNTIKLRLARKKLAKAVHRAKDAWLRQQCNELNDGILNARGTKPAWGAVGKLKSGMAKTRPTNVKNMKRPDKSVCKTPEENAEVFKEHFEKLFSRLPNYDVSVLEMLDQLTPVEDLDHPPTDEEIHLAIKNLRNTGPGESGICAQVYKCLSGSVDSYNRMKQMILHFWETGEIPAEWEIGILKILPKKGDLTNPGNYRGIMMLEVAYKIAANILKSRLIPIQESLDHEAQCGFRPGRGCADGIFTVKTALRKRREHGLETWVMFLDLVKAFDRVPRELLWKILEKFGVPEKIIFLLRSLHQNVCVKFSVCDIEHSMNSIIGVKQGDILGPVLFTFHIAAIMMTWRKVNMGPVCIFKTKEDFVMTGRSYRAYGDEFPLTDSEYADDTAALFDSRESLEVNAPLLLNHFLRFGMEVHKGNRPAGKDSKTEILFCSKPPRMYKDPSTYDVTDLSDIDLGDGDYLPIVLQFLYLGSVISSDCTDTLDVRTRIEKAGNAFGALSENIFRSLIVSITAKSFVYQMIVLTILLYGSESWCLTEALMQELSCFHSRCMRAMCRVTRKHTRIHRISNADLQKRLDLRPIKSYLTRRQLRWAGHVSRMSFDRLPRKMLSSWVRSKRPRGAPQMTYGRTIKRLLKCANIEVDSWHILAADRLSWKKTIAI